MSALKSASAVVWQRSLWCVWAAEADRVHSGACAEKHIGGCVPALIAVCVWAAEADRVQSGACAEKHIGGCVAALIAVCLGGRGRPNPQRCLR